MIWLARLLAQLLGVLLLLALTVAGAAAAVFCIQGGHGTLSLAGLVSDLHLAQLRDTIGSFFARLQAPGPVAVISALSGVGAILLGLVLLTGSLVSPRERLIVLLDGDDGQIAARRRALAQAAGELAEQPRSVQHARVRARPWRRKTGGRIRVRVRVDARPDGASDGLATRAVTGALAPLTESLLIRARVRAKSTQSTGRVH